MLKRAKQFISLERFIYIVSHLYNIILCVYIVFVGHIISINRDQ